MSPKPSFPAPEDRPLGPQVRDHRDVPSLSEVVLAHFKALEPEERDGRIKPVDGD